MSRASRLWLAALAALLLPVTAKNGLAQAPSRADAPYAPVVQAIREARKKSAADERDIAPLLAIIQGEAYPKALQEAAEQGDDAALRELYEGKYGEHWPRTVPGTPLLCYAALNDNVNIMRLLIQRKADVNLPNGEGWTPLHYAAEGGYAGCVTLLLDRGADPGAQTNRFGETPLMMACGLYGGGGQSTECARLLIGAGAEVNSVNSDNETALMFAADRGLIDTVRLLLTNKADVTVKDRKHRTALSRVVEFEHIDANGEITYHQDSVTVPTFKLKVFDALIRHGKVAWGLYRNEEVQKQVERTALDDFLSIARLLRTTEVEAAKKAGTQKRRPGNHRVSSPESKHP